jgi:hypothetical protein
MINVDDFLKCLSVHREILDEQHWIRNKKDSNHSIQVTPLPTMSSTPSCIIRDVNT